MKKGGMLSPKMPQITLQMTIDPFFDNFIDQTYYTEKSTQREKEERRRK